MNNEQLLQLTNHLAMHCNPRGLNGVEFESAYRLDGLQILPPLMTEIKRLEMQQLRLRALAIEMSLKRGKSAIEEQQLKSLKPLMVNASTNTVLPMENPDSDSDTVFVSVAASADPTIMSRCRQKLQRSETKVYSNVTTLAPAKVLPIEDAPQRAAVQGSETGSNLAPAKVLPISMATHLVVVDAPQRAAVVTTPRWLGTQKSSWVSKLGLYRPLQRWSTSAELRVQERMPERPVVSPSSTEISITCPKTAQGRFRSQIPVRTQRAPIVTKLQAPMATVILPGHGSSLEPNPVKPDSANERRRNYGAQVAMKRNEMARKREELAKLKPPPRTQNNQSPKSIRTPFRRVEAGSEDSELQQQRNRFPSLVLPQEPEQTNKNQVHKSIRTPIRGVEAGSEDSELQQERNRFPSLVLPQEPEQTNNNQVPKSNRTPIKRVEAGSEGSELQKQRNRFQSLVSRQNQELPKTNNNQVKSIRTPIRRMEAGEFQEPEQLQQRMRFPPLNIRQEQQQGSARTNNNQVPKSITTPIVRVQGAELLEPELLQQKDRLQSLISRQELEQQRLQAQLEQQQQGLIGQMVGVIADSQDTNSELVPDQD